MLPSLPRMLHGLCIVPAAQSTNAFMYTRHQSEIYTRRIFDVHPFEVHSANKLRPDACRVVLNFDSRIF